MAENTYVNVNGNFKTVKNLWLKAGGDWKHILNSWIKVDTAWHQVYSLYFVYNYSLASDALAVDYNLAASAVAAGWDRTKPLFATITIDGVLGSAVHGYAFDTGVIETTINSLPNIITVNVKGYITGQGGDAYGLGPSSAVYAQTPIYIVNNGIIQGGGVGGTSRDTNDCGGGAGYYGGLHNPSTGQDGPLNAGGAGGYNSAPKTANGGPGGDPGGTTAIVGFNKVTYSGRGTIKGGTSP